MNKFITLGLQIFNNSSYKIPKFAILITTLLILNNKYSNKTSTINYNIDKIIINDVSSILTNDDNIPTLKFDHLVNYDFNKISKKLTIYKDSNKNSINILKIPNLDLTKIIIDNHSKLSILNTKPIHNLSMIGINTNSYLSLPFALYPYLKIECYNNSTCFFSGIAINLTIQIFNNSLIKIFHQCNTVKCFASSDSKILDDHNSYNITIIK